MPPVNLSGSDVLPVRSKQPSAGKIHPDRRSGSSASSTHLPGAHSTSSNGRHESLHKVESVAPSDVMRTRARRMSDPAVKNLLSDVDPHIARHCENCRDRCANASPSEEVDCACHVFIEQELHEDLLKAKISVFSLKFGSQSLETSFLAQSGQLMRWSVRGLLILLALNFFISGWIVLAEGQRNTVVFFLAVVVPCCLVGLFKTVLPRRIKIFRFRDSALFWFLILIPGVILVVYSTRWQFETTSNAFTEYIFITYVFRPFFREFCMLMVLTQAGLLISNLALSNITPPTFHLYVVRVLLPIFCAGFSLYGLELNVRNEFLLTEQLRIEDKRSERLLQRLVPARVVKMLKETDGEVIAERVQDAVIFFLDLVNFTGTSAKIAPSDVVEFLNAIFTALDKLAAKHQVYKIETIGDAYFAASCNALSSSPVPLKRHMMRVMDFALDVRRAIPEMKFPFGTLNCRIGIHAGPVAAGVPSRLMPRYHFFGENVSIAELMEAHGVAGEIQVSGRVRKVLGDAYGFSEPREVDLKQFGGVVEGYLVTGKNEGYDPDKDPDFASWDVEPEDEPLAPRAGTLAAFDAGPASPASGHGASPVKMTTKRRDSATALVAAAAAVAAAENGGGVRNMAQMVGGGGGGLEGFLAPPTHEGGGRPSAGYESGGSFARRSNVIRRTLGDRLRQHFVAPGSVPFARRPPSLAHAAAAAASLDRSDFRGGAVGGTFSVPISAAVSRPSSRGRPAGGHAVSINSPVHSIGVIAESTHAGSPSPFAGRVEDPNRLLSPEELPATNRRMRRRVASRSVSASATVGALTSRPSSANGGEGDGEAAGAVANGSNLLGAGVASAKPSMNSQVSGEAGRTSQQGRVLHNLVQATASSGLPISLLTLRFCDESRPDMEARFKESFLRTCLHHSRVIVLFLLVLNVIAPGVDYGATENLAKASLAHRISLLVIRFGFLLPESILFLLLATLKSTQKSVQHPAFAWLVTLTHAAGFLALCMQFQNNIGCTSCRLYLYAALVVRMPFLWYFGFTACNVAVWVIGAYYNAQVLGDGSSSGSSWPLFLIQRLIFLYIMYQQEWTNRKLFYMKALLAEEEAATEQLLDSMLPRRIATQLKSGQQHTTEYIESASVVFCDIPALHKIRDATELVSILHLIFAAFDRIVQQSGVYKVETIGDVYMACCGGSLGTPEAVAEHARVMSGVALRLREAFIDLMDQIGDEELECRIGINTGPLIAGVIGISLPRLRLFGDTVNTASRMCTNCESGDIQITEMVQTRVAAAFECEPRGAIPIKGKGHLNTFYLRAPLAPPAPTAREPPPAGRLPPPALSLAVASGKKSLTAPNMHVTAPQSHPAFAPQPQPPPPAAQAVALVDPVFAFDASEVVPAAPPAAKPAAVERRASLQSLTESELMEEAEAVLPASTSAARASVRSTPTHSQPGSARRPADLARHAAAEPSYPGVPSV